MKTLSAFVPSHPLIFCVDSDGCVFDTMEIKHKECFCPAYIDHFNLQAIAKYAREAWEYANLYSVSRGMHRFITLRMSLELLADRAEVKERGFQLPDFTAPARPSSDRPMTGRWRSTRPWAGWCTAYRRSPTPGRALSSWRGLPIS